MTLTLFDIYVTIKKTTLLDILLIIIIIISIILLILNININNKINNFCHEQGYDYITIKQEKIFNKPDYFCMIRENDEYYSEDSKYLKILNGKVIFYEDYEKLPDYIKEW
jgi:hypothetical protein